jgi:ribosome-binding factor A
LQGLTAAAGFLRGEVGRRVGLRHAPRLAFVADESFDRAAELSALITAANKPRE